MCPRAVTLSQRALVFGAVQMCCPRTLRPGQTLDIWYDSLARRQVCISFGVILSRVFSTVRHRDIWTVALWTDRARFGSVRLERRTKRDDTRPCRPFFRCRGNEQPLAHR